jgi:hypothetical protein
MLQIPLPSIPPLAVAVLPISADYKGEELAMHQVRLMTGLAERGHWPVCNTADGAAIERNCQRRTAKAGTTVEHIIRAENLPDLIVEYYELLGKFWAILSDSKHDLKTKRNNLFSGARSIILGNYYANYQQIREHALDDSSPLYQRDVIKSDRQDDNAASRLFSAAMLEKASEDPSKHLGLVVYLFVFGEFIDAFQSRQMPHKDRARIVMRTLAFLETWKEFLRKQGYSENRHFISREAYDICKILANGLLALILIYRDHLPSPLPLFLWLFATESNEHTFGDMRRLIPDFSMLQALLMVPKTHALALTSNRAKYSKPNYKAKANGYQHTYLDTDGPINHELLSHFPTDMELSAAYKAASDENDSLWSLLGAHPDDIRAAPAVPAANKVDDYDEEDEDDEDAEQLESDLQDLQDVLDQISSTANLTLAEDNELDACTMAAVALALQKLADM